MRVVVLGGTRFIGRAIVEELAATDHQLLLVHRGETEPSDLPKAEHLHVERAALSSRRADLAAFKPDALVDCRALSRADARSVLDAAPKDIRLLVLSSMDVYRAFGAVLNEQETDGVPLDEESPVRLHRYPYAERMPDYDKLDVEEDFLAAGATVLRLPMVYGEHDYQRREEFILRRVRAGRLQIPFGAGTWLPTRGYVRDVARAVRMALATPAAAGEVFNIAERRTSTVRLWARRILEAAGFNADLIRVPDALLPADLRQTGNMSQHIVASAAKARLILGWTDSDPVAVLRTTVAWHLANPPEEEDPGFDADDEALAAAE